MTNALIINENDNVLVSIESIKSGGDITYVAKDGKQHSFKSVENIPIYHKIALKDVNKDEYFIKYGEHIGIAKTNVKTGSHVHEHNVESKREDLR